MLQVYGCEGEGSWVGALRLPLMVAMMYSGRLDVGIGIGVLSWPFQVVSMRNSTQATYCNLMAACFYVLLTGEAGSGNDSRTSEMSSNFSVGLNVCVLGPLTFWADKRKIK